MTARSMAHLPKLVRNLVIGATAGLVVVACQADSGEPTVPVPPPLPADGAPVTEPVPDVIVEPLTPTGSTAVVVSAHGVLGWWDGSNWVQAQGSAPLSGGETFRVHSVTRTTTTAIGSPPGKGCPLITGAVSVRLSPAIPDGLDGGIGVTAPWETEPHAVETAEADAVIDRAVSDLLAGLAPEVETDIVQLVTVDGDGDGAAEWYGVAERSSDPTLARSAPGDHSVAFVIGPDGIATKLDGLVVDADAVRQLAVIRIAAFADIDHDGLDEVALGLAYSEGSGTRLVDRMSDGGHRVVLNNGCGV